MKTELVTIFEEGDKVYFLKDGRKEVINGTVIQFCFVSDGVIVASSDDGYTIRRDEMEIQVPPRHPIFVSYEEAVAKSKELNNENLSKLEKTYEKIVGWIKGYYPL